jgi:hypothetical protein
MWQEKLLSGVKAWATNILTDAPTTGKLLIASAGLDISAGQYRRWCAVDRWESVYESKYLMLKKAFDNFPPSQSILLDPTSGGFVTKKYLAYELACKHKTSFIEEFCARRTTSISQRVFEVGLDLLKNDRYISIEDQAELAYVSKYGDVNLVAHNLVETGAFQVATEVLAITGS